MHHLLNLLAVGGVAWYELTFGPVPGRERVQLLIMTNGDKVERAVVTPYGVIGTDASGLKLDGKRFTGQIVVGHQQFENNHSIAPLAKRLPVRFDLTIEGNEVTGTFAGTWPDRRGAPVAVTGAVSGARRDNTFPAEAEWPSYLGPNQKFSSGLSARPLVADISQARLVWASQYIGPPEAGSMQYGACVGVPGAAGGASPLVYRGRVYQFRYQPAGDVYQKHLDDQLAGPRAAEWKQKMAEVGWTEADMRRRWAIDANEQLVCLDAATGQTLWTVDWPGDGIHLYDHKCSLTGHTGVAVRGRFYVFGALGIVRCMDADTGKQIWRAELPGYFDMMKKFKADALAKRVLHAPTRSFGHHLNVCGNTVVAPDGIAACGLVGLDAATGKVLWHVPKVLGKYATPLAWRDCVIAANAEGVVTCIQAADGKVLWRYDQAGDNEYSVVLSGDLLFGHKLKADDRKKSVNPEEPDDVHSAPGENYGQIACWELSQTGLEQVWESPAAWGATAFGHIGAVSGDLFCFRGNYSYYLVKAETGERIATSRLPVPVRWDEGHMLALPGMFLLNPDSQHGQTKFFTLPARAGAVASALWLPPHPPATTYQSALSHAWADGRAFIRGADAIYCYDLRVNK